MHSILYTMHTILYTLYTIHYTLYTIHCTLYTIDYTHYTLYALYTPYTIHYIHYTLYPMQASPTPCTCLWAPVCAAVLSRSSLRVNSRTYEGMGTWPDEWVTSTTPYTLQAAMTWARLS